MSCGSQSPALNKHEYNTDQVETTRTNGQSVIRTAPKSMRITSYAIHAYLYRWKNTPLHI